MFTKNYWIRRIKLLAGKLSSSPKIILRESPLYLSAFLVAFLVAAGSMDVQPRVLGIFDRPLLPQYSGLPVPDISARNIFIIDRNSKMVMYRKRADERIYPASTTKMMTGLVVYENMNLDQEVSVPAIFSEGANIHLTTGEKLTVDNLLYALLVQSANDSAEVLAANYPGGRAKFIDTMNRRALALNLGNTNFLNPTGLDQEGHYSSAADLARLADRLLQYPYLAKIVSTQNAVITTSDYSSYHSLTNVNQLLGKIPGVMGVKTGFTDLAGQSLVTLVNRHGHEVIISLMGSTDRFSDTEKIIDWVYSAYSWVD